MPRTSDADLFESSKMSFGEHLDELRGVLIKALIATTIGVAIGFLPPVSKWVVGSIQAPLRAELKQYRVEQALIDFEAYAAQRARDGLPMSEEELRRARQQAALGLKPQVQWFDAGELLGALRSRGLAPPGGEAVGGAAPDQPLVPLTVFSEGDRTRTIGTSPIDGFAVYVKAAIVVGVVLASPAIFYFFWSFVASGLYAEERRYVYIFAPFSLGLFLLGAGVAFFLALGYVLDTLFWFNRLLDIDPLPQISAWLSFALLLPLGFGAGFQLPLVMLFLERIGVFSAEQYLASWKLGVLVIAVASMLLTPSDWQSMVLLGVPMTALYFGGIALCRYLPRRKTPFGAPVA
ncbi:MAG: twin-arginine translocase subunit TatC [Planctomycetota bacterium]